MSRQAARLFGRLLLMSSGVNLEKLAKTIEPQSQDAEKSTNKPVKGFDASSVASLKSSEHHNNLNAVKFCKNLNMPYGNDQERITPLRRMDEPLRITLVFRNDDIPKCPTVFLNIVLRPISEASSPFAKDLKVFHDDISYDIKPQNFLYEGYVEGDPKSKVFGSVFDGIFDGHIEYNGYSYTVEKYAKFNGFEEHPAIFRSRICFDDGEGEFRLISWPTKRPDDISDREDSSSERHNANNICSGDNIKSSINNAKTCTMHLTADHTLYQEILSKEGGNDQKRTREEIVSLFFTHMKVVNDIYENVNFKGIEKIKFLVKQITIESNPVKEMHTTDMERRNDERDEISNNDNYPHYQIRKKDHSEFCLSYVFTYQRFKNILGNAYQPIPDIKCHVGLCGYFSIVWGSCNTGFITLRCKGRRISPRISQLNFAHEISHSLGAGHDDEGEFLMAPTISCIKPTKIDNFKLSPQSIDEITAVLDTLQREAPKRIPDEASTAEFWFKYEPCEPKPNTKRNCLQCKA